MKIRRQILSILVSACLVAGMLPTVSFAAEDSSAVIGTSGLCGHHTAHDEACGYVEGREESPCTHEHGTECYTEVTSCIHIHTVECYPVLENSVSGNEAAEPAECSHVCSGESGCIVQELNCTHEHDGICGYVPAVEGHPCTYVCGLCGLTEITAWSWVDELEVIDPSSGILALSGAESPVLYDEIVALLPAEITATAESGTETVALGGWSCDNYPAEGADTGNYLFNAVLPDGYTLAENVPALTVTVELGGVAVLDGTEHSSHPICGAAHKDIGDHTGTCENVTWTAWNGTDEIPYDADNTAYVYLTDNVTRDATLEVKANYTLYLCLDGHNITKSTTGQIIQVGGNAKFILCNCQSSGTITHSTDVKGKGVKVGSNNGADATFIMYGGEISGNHVGTSDSKEDGAGVAVSGGIFTMYGGKIRDNHVDAALNYGGGGVLASDDFIMYGGEISSNTSSDYGGGVMAWGSSASAAIYGGIISGNTATGNGGGICTNNPLVISGNSVIENNRAENGGGVYFYGYYSDEVLTISDSVKIAGNTATGDGGGIAVKNGGALTINGGSITGNNAAGNGGGVYFNSKNSNAIKISGGIDISGNTKNSVNNNVYLPTNKYITIAGELTGGNKIGVTTEATPDSSSYVRIATGNKVYADPEKFQYENDNTLSVSTVISGSSAKLVVCKHSLSSDWSTDSSSHWHQCSICKGQKDTAAHTYDREVAVEGYKKSDATCTSKATYYKSCVCGAKGTETFESGELNSDSHTGSLSDWKSDDSNHWKEYSCCGAHVDTAAHTGGTADCQNKAVCDTCNQPYGNLGSHDPASIWSKDASGHWHVCQTANCTEKFDFTAHTPGAAATEETAQTCTECGYELAPALEHTHVWGDWTSNGDGTHTRICSKDSSHTETNSCSGGTADCQNKAVCDTCHQPYGELGSHDPASIWSKDASGHWHVCQTANCTEKFDFTAHTPGAAATEETAQTCTECGYELAPALEHTHVWGDWTSNGDGTHTRICSKDSSHTETNSCSGGTATCQSPAVCAACSQPYGDKDMNSHTGGTEVRGSVEATTSAAGYTGDTYCKGCNTKLADGNTIPKKEDNTGGGSNDSGSDNNTSFISVTVPVSGDENTIRVDATVSGTTATIETVDLSKLDTVIGNNVKTGIVTIDFSVLEIEVDIVKLPANVVKQIAEAVNDPDNDAEGLEIVLTDGTSIEFDAKALDKNAAQANGNDITISIKPATDNMLNDMQRQAVGSRPALDINVTSGGRNISDMGGKVTIYVPYELRSGERASGIVVYYVDGNGNRERCETGYDPVKKRVNWKTSHFSVYMIGYDESVKKSPVTGDDDPVYVTYTVQKGDTLWAIARKYGCTVSEIVAANSDLIKKPNLIYKGWQLQIPQDETMGADSADAILPDNRKTGVYIVKRGDTLWVISRKYGCTVAEIVGLNGKLITDPDLIFAGWELEIPQD